MPELHVSLLGPVQLEIGGRAVSVSGLQKASELLALLLLAPQRQVTREAAAAALWPDASTESSRKAIRQTLWQLRQLGGREADSRTCADRLVVGEGQVIAFNPEWPLWLDVAAFQASAASSRWDGSAPPTDDEVEVLRRATALYRGPLLTGCYEDWCQAQRAHLEDLQITLLDRLSEAHERRSELGPAIRSAQLLLDIEPAHERTHRRLMSLYYRNDDRTRALRQFARCRDMLQRDLGVRPSPRTERLAAMIADDGRELAGGAQLASGEIETVRREMSGLWQSLNALEHRLDSRA